MTAQTGKKNIIAGNWKMNLGLKASEALALTLRGLSDNLKKSEIWIAPSAIALAATTQALKGSAIRVGSQNVCAQKAGAFTGEVSVAMLQEIAVSFALVGHSERRSLYAESIDQCVARAFGAIEQGLDVVFCVGESLSERESGSTFEVVSAQLKPLLEALKNNGSVRSLVIAYEPVWAIGTGKVATTEQIAETHRDIHQLLSQYTTPETVVPILYGGSVTADNFASIIALEHVSGALVGGASLLYEKFAPLLEISEL
jgi:triosephosphate isomerase (TIM)